MKYLLVFGAGAVLGAILLAPPAESSCCKRVAASVRDDAKGILGGTATSILDALGVFDRSPAFLDFIGVPHDYVG